jgi:hypothetical protein
MRAIDVKNSLVSLLDAHAAGRFVVTGLKDRRTDAKKIVGMPQVTVYYKSGQFPRNKSSINGPYQHEASLQIEILVGAKAEMDLTAIREGGTPEEIMIALAGKIDAEKIADQKMDETFGVLFDIIMRPQNRTLGMADDPDRWITDFTKGDPAATGAIVVLAAVFTMSYRSREEVTEEVGTLGTAISSRIGISGDTAGSFTEGESAYVKASK